MIVPMRKLYIAARSKDRDRLLRRIRALGVVHLTPADPRRSGPDDGDRRKLDALGRAIQVLSEIPPRGSVPEVPPAEAAEEVLDIQRRAAEGRHRLAVLHRELEELKIWGDVRLRQFEELREAGIDVRFYTVPQDFIERVQAECVTPLARISGGRWLVAVVDRAGQAAVPEGSTPVPLPSRDAPSIRSEAGEIDSRLKHDATRLAELAHLLGQLRRERVRLRQEVEYRAALQSAAGTEHLFAVQGWAPAEAADALADELARAGFPAVVRVLTPEPDEEPPTLIRYGRFAKPIKAMFDVLGTVAGYREYDVSLPFMIALPIFSAMLISDGGYSALILLVPLVFYRLVAERLGKAFAHLLIVVGAVGLAWGALSGSFFGFVLYDPPIPVDLSERSRTLLMKLSFTMGAIHLSVAHMWQAARYFPNLRFLGKVGSAVFIWGMYGAVRMFVLRGPMGWDTPWPYLLIVGAVLAIVFHTPSRNILAMLGIGLAQFPLSVMGAFSDVISYVRLMAVGLASSVLAANFNDLALGMGSWPIAAVILILGHGLNIGLALVALFAHGVRLNMLEFASNLGMQWTGYPYDPFVERVAQEQHDEHDSGGGAEFAGSPGRVLAVSG